MFVAINMARWKLMKSLLAVKILLLDSMKFGKFGNEIHMNLDMLL